ncbi:MULTISPECIES: methyl-accepting chemotaxis protein [unclassified Herbaspirillum]|uniref:methyl-accepting chemotaxis protein n=1 Tax=unclassified Herbaspirillum TaxID=2624150 RepID=UPI001150FD80|nr:MULTISPECIES: methyl-accepting chemotaxis protein [unclassified Herbaspirillum]MBB5392286.1 methyl-accepting chemotaxis protein-1 (serine sensor receptor) [Herbaspirillum sp. SJZ102]TQK05927.1 methyl-accepting chemotaxis sensory transducer with TarH sensor [Herbaspirillum sp. SJZ130]TQK12595.1 methyl-accepting chemotaxis sensory transducer with TarH sensor [Herbaspirillum sp. SJZ106]
MFSKLTIKARLIFVIGFLAVLLAASGVLGLASLHSTNAQMRSLYEDRLVALSQLGEIAAALDTGRYGISTAIVGDSGDIDKGMDKLEKTVKDSDKILQEYLGTYLTPEEKMLVDKLVPQRQKFIAEGVKPAAEALRNRDFQGASDLYNGVMLQLFNEAHASMTQLMNLQRRVGGELYENAQRRYQTLVGVMLAAIGIGLAVAVFMGFILVRAISRPLEQAVKVAQGVAAGDLTQDIEVRSRDETGQLMQALKEMNGNLLRIVGEVRTGTDTINTAAAEIASGNLDLSSRTEQQAGSLEETASAMEELTSTVKQNADNARQANQLAASASDVASRGGDVVRQVVDTMSSINDSSRKIVDIISVIDGIAFQTNILALNAAVEAARAGEQGRGFAVVASEVRSLAQRSASAAKEIKALIDDSVSKVGNGSTLVAQAGATMDEVVASVRRVTDVMGEITAASQEQSSGIEEINRAVTQMDETTQQNAALVEEAAAAAQSLQEQASRLSTAVSVFRLHGMQAAPAVSVAPVVASAASAAPAAKPLAALKATAPKAAAAPRRPSPKLTAPASTSPKSAAGAGDDWEQF